MKYRVIKSSDNSLIGKEFPYTEVAPILKLDNDNYLVDMDTGTTYIRVDDAKEPTVDNSNFSMGLIVVGLLIFAVFIFYMPKKK
jgi:hypothetical protein